MLTDIISSLGRTNRFREVPAADWVVAFRKSGNARKLESKMPETKATHAGSESEQEHPLQSGWCLWYEIWLSVLFVVLSVVGFSLVAFCFCFFVLSIRILTFYSFSLFLFVLYGVFACNSTYQSNLQKAATFNTVEDFWRWVLSCCCLCVVSSINE